MTAWSLCYPVHYLSNLYLRCHVGFPRPYPQTLPRRQKQIKEMSSRYRVEYHLKAHRKDVFIEWIKGLLAVPFVLHAVSQDEDTTREARARYAEIFRDIEVLVDEKLQFDLQDEQENDLHMSYSRLDQLVPGIGCFFTPLPLKQAFFLEDKKRTISSRRMVSPSFNDIRQVLNTAQILHLAEAKGSLKLVTFDGDVTLYEDGGSITPQNKVISRIVALLKRDINVGVVTAAGYDEAIKYVERLHGLVEALQVEKSLTLAQKRCLTIMGGESNYLFQYFEKDGVAGFVSVPDEKWMPSRMTSWSTHDMKATLDLAQLTLEDLKAKLNLPPETTIVRKPRAVGIVPGFREDGETARLIRVRLFREQLEEMVLTVQRKLENFAPARRIQFSCFDGGSDVWCDIGGKDLGVKILQQFYNKSTPIKPHETLHIGDQFAPLGSANDFKARLAGCTLWIASPEETVTALDDLLRLLDNN